MRPISLHLTVSIERFIRPVFIRVFCSFPAISFGYFMVVVCLVPPDKSTSEIFSGIKKDTDRLPFNDQ
jgi:hypothetical protein